MSCRPGGELTWEEGLGGDKEELSDRTLATKAGEIAEALIGTPSSSGCRCEISMLSLPPLLGASAGGDRSPKSDPVNSFDVMRMGISRGADMLSTRRSSWNVSNIRDGFPGAGA